MEEWQKPAFMESIMHPEDKPAIMEKIYNNLTVGNNFSLEYRIIKKDGSYMWINDNIRPIKNTRNQAVGARGGVHRCLIHRANEGWSGCGIPFHNHL